MGSFTGLTSVEKLLILQVIQGRTWDTVKEWSGWVENHVGGGSTKRISFLSVTRFRPIVFVRLHGKVTRCEAALQAPICRQQHMKMRITWLWRSKNLKIRLPTSKIAGSHIFYEVC